MGQPMISLRDLYFEYPTADGQRKAVLRGIDLDIEVGEYVALIGANGSGKTTLLRHLNALLLPTRGQVLVAGLDTRDEHSHAAIRQQVAMVFQFPEDQIVASVVEDDVAFGLINLGLPPEEIRVRVDAVLHTLGLWEHRRRPPHLLSAGQMQRLALAGVLVMQPRCLVLDEPTTMLDPLGRERLLRLLDNLNREGMTIIHVTHHMEEAVRAQRVLVLEQGRVVLDGAPQEVFAQAAYLEGLGLDLPPAARLAQRLRRFFPGLPADILTTDALLTHLPVYVSPPTAPSTVQERTREARERYWLVEAQGLKHTHLAGTPLAHEALRGVDLYVAEGWGLVLMGATGSGKSTLLQHLNGLLLPQQGQVRVGPFDLTSKSTDLRAVRRFAGLLMQNPEMQFFETFVGDEVAYAPRVMGLGDVRERVRWALNMVGLDFEAYKDRRLFTLSGGERRKVALASVLAMQPPLLLLDEPTAGLDAASRRSLLVNLQRLKANGVTFVIASHHLDDLLSLTDWVEILHHGQNRLSGRPADVFGVSQEIQDTGVIPPLVFSVLNELRRKGWPVEAVRDEVSLFAVLEALTQVSV